jgi:hypothetical protein
MTAIPLWPAGHLPHKGGEDMRHPVTSIIARRFGWAKPFPLWGGWGGATCAASHFPAALRSAAAPSRMTEIPLWPAGHLPHKGGEDMRHPIASIMARRFGRLKPSPLWGGLGGVTCAASHFPAAPRSEAAPHPSPLHAGMKRGRGLIDRRGCGIGPSPRARGEGAGRRMRGVVGRGRAAGAGMVDVGGCAP